MSDAVLVALIAGLSLMLSTATTALFGVFQGRKTRRGTAQVHAQLVPNGGSSLRDSLDRVERKVDDLGIGLEYLNRRVDHDQ